MRRYLSIVAAAILVQCLSGWGGDGLDPVTQPISIDIPLEFVRGSKKWKKADASERANIECLSRFFASHQELAGSPELEGEPHLFRSGASDRRFYWISSSTMGSTWSCVACEGGKFTLSDGAGSPFTE